MVKEKLGKYLGFKALLSTAGAMQELNMEGRWERCIGGRNMVYLACSFSFAVLFIKTLESLCRHCFSVKAAPSSSYGQFRIAFPTAASRSVFRPESHVAKLSVRK